MAASCHHLGGVGIVAIAAAIYFIIQFLFKASLHDTHSGNGSAQESEEIGNQFALL